MQTIFCWLIYWWAALHPIHVSITELTHNSRSKSVEITHKIFIDDLENALLQRYKVKTFLATPNEHPDSQKLIAQYLAQQFSLGLNGQAAAPQYLGREYENDAVWVYTEVSNVQAVQQVRVRNRLLLDIFDDQSNFVYVNAGGQRKSLRLSLDNETSEISF